MSINTKALTNSTVWWFRIVALLWILAAVVIALPIGGWGLIESKYCEHQAKANPAEYDQCFICNYWFQHKRMTFDHNVEEWICNGCWGRR